MIKKTKLDKKICKESCFSLKSIDQYSHKDKIEIVREKSNISLDIYQKRDRPKKFLVQDKVTKFLQQQSKKYPELKNRKVITLSGTDPNNAIKAVSGTSPSNIILYENNPLAYIAAKLELDKITKELNPIKYKLIEKDIFNKIHTDCSCFYYDFCTSYKSVNWRHIKKEFKTQMDLGRSFAIVYTLALRKAKKVDTINHIKRFNKSLLNYDDTYELKTIDKIYSYLGGGNNGQTKGNPMLVWAGTFIKGDNNMSIRSKFPGLFNEEEQKQTTEKEVKVMKKTNKKATKTTDNNMTKEMVHTLLSNRSRKYTNQDIAEMTGLSVRQVAAMAAWHHPSLAKKRK